MNLRNRYDMTVLHMVAADNNTFILLTLLRSGASINAVNKSWGNSLAHRFDSRRPKAESEPRSGVERGSK